MLTKEQKQAYVESGGNACPYCESFEIEAGRSETDSDYHIIHVECMNCGKEWWDVYHLSTIEEID